MAPFVSIIIPNYNTAHYLAEAIDSVYNSSFRDFEVVVIDDGSIDNSAEVVKPYQKLESFKYISQANKGLSGARNTGIRAASGKYLVFLDSDDIILPDKLKLQVEFLESNQDYNAVYSASVFFKDGSPEYKLETNFPNYSGAILEQLLFGNFIHVNAIMVRKDAVVRAGLFDETLKELEDWDLWLRLSIAGSKFYHQSKVLSEVRLRKGSMTSDQVKMNTTMVRVLQKNIQELKTSHSDDKKLIKHANEALFQYKLLAKQTLDFNNSLYKVTTQLGIGFIPTALKLFIKRYVTVFAKKQNKTTVRLEQIWNE